MTITNIARLQRDDIKEWSYVVAGSGKDDVYRVQFTQGKIDRYIARRGDRFNLVIMGSDEVESDYYVVPWASVSGGFTEERLQLDKRVRRWMVHVRSGFFKIYQGGEFKIDISATKGNATMLLTPSWV